MSSIASSPTVVPTLPLSGPLPDLAAWVACFDAADIPILAETAEALESMRANEDAVDANLIGEMIAGDPLMTLKVLAFAAQHRPDRVVTDTETVTAAVVMMGISPFFRDFGPQATVEDRLRDQPEALAGLQQVIRRAHRAANFAVDFAAHRLDPDAAVIHLAALLHDFPEMLLWCHAPALALRIRDVQSNDSTARSCDVQRDLLNVELLDLKQALMSLWKLPELLIRITDDRHADQSNVRSVMLAVRLARHTSSSWDNPAIPDDVAEIAQLLTLSVSSTMQLLREIDA